MKTLLPLLAFLSLLCSVNAAPKPNIVYFYADDLGWGALKANYPSSQLLTPNLDALVASGANFSRGYGCMVCSPARSSQQLGFHQGHTWTDRNDPDKTKAIRAEDTTVGTIVKSAGYRTGYYGKWGYGADYDKIDPAINNPQTLPINHGYDELLAELHHKRAHTFFQPTLWSHVETSPGVFETQLIPNTIPKNNPNYPNYPNYPNLPAYQNDAGYPATAYCDDTYAFAAMDFIRTNAQSGQPFFATLAFQIPHTPLGEIDGLPNWFDAYADVPGSADWAQGSKQFAAMVTRMDAHIGNIMDVLRDPNGDGDTSDSVLENTLIIFASDNGGQSGPPKTFFQTNGILSGSKGSVQEGGIRVPTVMSWPGTIAAGQNITTPVDVTDVLPTLAELVGAEAPVGTDGVSIAPLLTGHGAQRTRDYLCHESGSSWSIIKGDYKMRNNGNLYNLSNDPSESTNLLNQTSDPNYADYLALRDELNAVASAEFLGLTDTFANSFRTWTGSDGAAFEADASWSDPAYPAGHELANDYSDNTPNAQWNAVMRNTQNTDATTTLATNVDLLALEIGSNTTARQSLVVPTTLTGRNEIRINANGALQLEGGTLKSARWVDIKAEGTLTGAGTIDSNLYHGGQLTLTQAPATEQAAANQELILNGSFENGTLDGSGDYSFNSLDHWTTNGDATLDGAKGNKAQDGTFRGLLQTGVGLIQDTGHNIALDETYQLSFWHQGFSNWSTGEEITVRLFYINDSAQEVDLFSQTLALTSGSWIQANYPVPAITDTNAVGKSLRVSFLPANGATGFASLDSVSLTLPTDTVTIPGHRRLEIAGRYLAYDHSKLTLTLAGNANAGDDYSQLIIQGEANLNGTLDLTLDNNFQPSPGDSFTILTAASVNGRFQHADNSIKVGNAHYRIRYTPTAVLLENVATTTSGVPHWWFDEQGISGNDYETLANTDSDGDGVLNKDEWIAGSHPTNSQSLPSLQLVKQGNTMTLEWPSHSNRRYFVESSTDLINYTPYSGPHSTSSPLNSFSPTPNSEQHRFFRIKIERE
ncbi:sulfatase-like hydrolase/transferase [Rubritalea tangerina]|uniref:Sulfatase-like hydrolase/transferase n=1 Tax=Rubritalea tangerina TaxID=430798 RepID=A0ABW4Z5L6_9BACT